MRSTAPRPPPSVEAARAVGDYPIFGLAGDGFNAVKNKNSFYSHGERKLLLEAVRHVDRVIPRHHREQKQRDIREHGIDGFMMGEDRQGESDELKKLCEVDYPPRTAGASSTQTKAMPRVTKESKAELRTSDCESGPMISGTSNPCLHSTSRVSA